MSDSLALKPLCNMLPVLILGTEYAKMIQFSLFVRFAKLPYVSGQLLAMVHHFPLLRSCLTTYSLWSTMHELSIVIKLASI